MSERDRLLALLEELQGKVEVEAAETTWRPSDQSFLGECLHCHVKEGRAKAVDLLIVITRENMLKEIRSVEMSDFARGTVECIIHKYLGSPEWWRP